MSINITQKLDTLKSLESEVISMSKTWENLAKKLDPFNPIVQNNCSNIVNTAAIESLSELVAYFLNYFTNYGSRPVKLKPKSTLYDLDEGENILTQDQIKIAEKVEKQIYQILQDYDTGIHQTVKSELVDMLIFSVGAFEISADELYENVYLKHIPVNTIFFTQDKNCQIDCVFRKITFTLHQLKTAFSKDECSAILEAENINEVDFDKDPNKTIELVQLIQERNIPNKEDIKLQTKLNKKFGSYYIHEKSKQLIKEDGYDFMPIIIPRLERRGNQKYGASRPMIMEKIIMHLESLTQSVFRKDDLDMNPAFLMYFGDITQRIDKIYPGQRVVLKNPAQSPVVQKLYVNDQEMGNVQNSIMKLETTVRRMMFLNEINASPVFYDKDNQAKRDMTATEVKARQDSAAMQLAATALQIEKELFKPLIDTLVFIIKQREIIKTGGQGSDVSDSDYELEIGNIYRDIYLRHKQDKFNSIIINSQAIAGNLGNPNILQNIDMDKLYRDAISLYDDTGDYLIDETTRDKQREMQAQAQANAMAQQQGQVQ